MNGPERRGCRFPAAAVVALVVAVVLAPAAAPDSWSRASAAVGIASQELTGETVPAAAPDGQPPPSAAAGHLPPRPVLVEPIPDRAGGATNGDSDGGPAADTGGGAGTATDAGGTGAVRVRPFAEVFAAEAGRSYQPTFVIDNDSGAPVDLELGVTGLGVGTDGAPRPGAGAGRLAAAGSWITLPTDRLHLDPFERAFLWPAIDVPAGALAPAGGEAAGGAGAAIRVTGDGVDLSALVVLAADSVGGSEAGARLVRGEGGNARVDLELTAPAGAADVVTGRLAVRGWFGAVIEVDLPPTLVAPGTTRVQTVEFTGPAVPGRYEAVADLRSLDGTAPRATASAWLNPPRTLLAGSAIVLVLTAVVLLYRVRRRALVDGNG